MKKTIENYLFKAMYEISFDLFLTMQLWLYYLKKKCCD